MYIQNGRDSSKFKGCSPILQDNGLLDLKPETTNFPNIKQL